MLCRSVYVKSSNKTPDAGAGAIASAVFSVGAGMGVGSTAASAPDWHAAASKIITIQPPICARRPALVFMFADILLTLGIELVPETLRNQRSNRRGDVFRGRGLRGDHERRN